MTPEIETITRESERKIRTAKLAGLMAEPYEKKVGRGKATVHEFVDVLGLPTVYVSTSGGKDSACLSALCKEEYPEIKHVMFDTGLEYAATVDLARRQGAEIIKPCTGWKAFCDMKGYPVGSKQVSKRIHDAKIGPKSCALTLYNKTYHLAHKWLHFMDEDIPISPRCCDEFKKKPAKQLGLNPIIGTRIQESAERKNAWKKTGCNSYSMDGKHGVSRPLSLFTDEDIETYVIENNVQLSALYTQYQAKRTGCCICPYGAHLEDGPLPRFDLLKLLEPKRYEHFMRTPLRRILLLSGVKIESDPEYMQELEETQKEVDAWHKEAKGMDNYFSWKIRWCVKQHGANAMIEAVKHIHKGNDSFLMYPLDTIVKAIEAEGRIQARP